MTRKSEERANVASERVKLRHLRLLAAVIERGSMAGAAERLSMTQPAVSKAIADLEQIVGMRLLERTSEGVEPTIYGQALHKRSIGLFDELKSTMSELSALADPEVGYLRIGASESVATTLLPAIVQVLARKTPGVTLDIVFADAGALIDRELRGRRVDLVIGRTAQLAADDLDISVLVRDRLHIVAARDNALSRKRRVSLSDLVDEPWVLPDEGNPIRLQIADAFKRQGLQPPESVVTVASPIFTRRLVEGGNHIGALGSLFLSFDDAPRLYRLPIELPPTTWPVSLVTLRNRVLNPAVKLFAEAAHDVASSIK